MRLFRRKPSPRVSRRIPVAQPVQLTPAGASKPVKEVTGNLSLTGMFVATRFPLKRGTRITFALTLDHRVILGSGEVVWSRTQPVGDEPSGMGVQIQSIQAQGKKLLHDFIQRYIDHGGFADLGSTDGPGDPGLVDKALDPLLGTFGRSARRARPKAGRSGRRVAVTAALLVAALAGVAVLVTRVDLLSRLLDEGMGEASALAEAAPEPVRTELDDGQEAVVREELPAQPPGRHERTAPDPPVRDREPARRGGGEPAPAVPGRERRKAPAPSPATSQGGDDVSRPRSLTGLDQIFWARSDGQLTVTLVGDGPFPRYTHLRLVSGSVRELVRIEGVSRPFATNELPVAEPEIERIRLGYHAKPEGNELHVVIDMADPAARLQSIEEEDRKLVLRFGRGG